MKELKTIELEHRTFSKSVKKVISEKLDKVAFFYRYDKKTVSLMNSDKKTVAIWEQTFTGSRIVFNSWY